MRFKKLLCLVFLMSHCTLLLGKEGAIITDPIKDALMYSLIQELKNNAPEILSMDEPEKIQYQTYSYMGDIRDQDSLVIFYIMILQTKFKEETDMRKKVLVFDGTKKFLGCYLMADMLPQHIINHKYLTFEYNEDNTHVKRKIDFSHGVPETFKVMHEEFVFERKDE